MSARKIIITLSVFCCLLAPPALADSSNSALSYHAVANELGWVNDPNNYCGGYYLENEFPFWDDPQNIHISSNEGFIALRGTSVLEKGVKVSKKNEEMTANRAFLYRDPVDFKLTSTDMIGDVHMREPNTLIIARRGYYNFQTKTKSLKDIIYRTTLFGTKIVGPHVPAYLTRVSRPVKSRTAWGQADEFSQELPRVYEFLNATYSTCPPENRAWQIRASKIVLNKNTGRGQATNARLYIKDVPILYTPYMDFPIDKTRKSGFLWPKPGPTSNKFGPYLLVPLYWNIAPNFDMTSTVGFLSKRGIQWMDDFRYLTSKSIGRINLAFIPYDSDFAQFQRDTAADPSIAHSNNVTIQAEFNRLMSDSTARGGFFWRDDSIYDAHWSSHVDINYASDDYYLQTFGSNLNETTANQLLNVAELNYKSLNWNVTGRLQGYQTLHPISFDQVIENQYRRFPQLTISGDYPDQRFGFEYFITSEVTHFDIRNTPGTAANNKKPIGNRMHAQPGINWPFSLPYFYINPRFQLALTEYQLYQTSFTNTPTNIKRGLPIFDIASGLSLSRRVSLFGQNFQQTLEPQVYYTYIPYHDQSEIPLFDTTVTELTYEQLFSYNRFSGLDRIGDANQISLGVTTRFIDNMSGIEKIRFGIGGIVYFTNRRVTLTESDVSTNNPTSDANKDPVSPLTASLDYHVNPLWTLSSKVIWNIMTMQLSNSTVGLHYQPDPDHIVNLGFSFVRNGNYLNGMVVNDSENNLEKTEISFVWPLRENFSVVGRWTQDWFTGHFQDIIYGLQYDTCCWSLSFVKSKTFSGLKEDKRHPGTSVPGYNSAMFLTFELKGIGELSNRDPSAILNTINGYKKRIDQEF